MGADAVKDDARADREKAGVDVIRFRCPECGQALRAPGERAGKRGKCPCGATVIIRPFEPPPPPAPKREVAAGTPTTPGPRTDWRRFNRKQGVQFLITATLYLVIAICSVAGVALIAVNRDAASPALWQALLVAGGGVAFIALYYFAAEASVGLIQAIFGGRTHSGDRGLADDIRERMTALTEMKAEQGNDPLARHSIMGTDIPPATDETKADASASVIDLDDGNFEEVVAEGVTLIFVPFSLAYDRKMSNAATLFLEHENLVNELARRFAGHAKVAKLDVLANPKAAGKLSERLAPDYPDLMLFKDGRDILGFKTSESVETLCTTIETTLSWTP
jgi:hypothetical protein